MTWRCSRCRRTSGREGMCPKCRLLYVLDTPPEPPPTERLGPPASAGAELAPAADMISGAGPASAAAPPVERLALRTPWRQQINLPDEGELVLGRSSPEFRAHPEASATHQISRRHVRFFRNEHGDLYVQDLNSANGTYIDGVLVEGRPSRLRSGQVLRLAQDVDCSVLRLNEHGEPEGDDDRDDPYE